MTLKTVFDKRLALLKDELHKRKLDAFLVTKDANVSYLSGFAGHDAVILITSEKNFFIADSRYIEEAKESVKGFIMRLSKKSLYGAIGEITAAQKPKRIGFESTDLSYEVVNRLKNYTARGSLVPARELIEDIRAVKGPEETALIRKSIALAKRVFEYIEPLIKPGASEEVLAGKIGAAFLENGAKPGFDPIVAVDENSSKPHATSGERKVSKNSFVMIDMGCSLKKYNSDITRMVSVGSISPRIKKIEAVVRSAQKLAIDAIRPGERIAEIDRAARQYIKSKSFGKYFTHALGHGVGIEVHEKPSISPAADGLLRPGMVFTVEPAIYIPKFGGVRVEDMVLVTDKGCEILS